MLLWIEKENMYLEEVPADEAEHFYTDWFFLMCLPFFIQNIKIASGDARSPMFEMYRELEFLQVCLPL